MAEGAPLLRVYMGNRIEGSNPSLSAIYKKSPPALPGGLFLYLLESEYMVRTSFEKNAGSVF